MIGTMAENILEDNTPVLNFGKHKGRSLKYIRMYQTVYLSMLMWWCTVPPPWSKKTNLMECLPYLKEWKVDSKSGQIWIAVYSMSD